MDESTDFFIIPSNAQSNLRKKIAKLTSDMFRISKGIKQRIYIARFFQFYSICRNSRKTAITFQRKKVIFSKFEHNTGGFNFEHQTDAFDGLS